MKFALFTTAVVATLAFTSATSDIEIHVKVLKGPNDICYRWCNPGTYCVIGSDKCTKPPSGQCFNPATSKWIAKCDPGFKCKNGKCDYAKRLGKKENIKGPNDICYKSCPSGQYCVIGSDKCEAPPANKCFNPAKSIWIDKCDPGFTCVNGRCEVGNAPADDDDDEEEEEDSEDSEDSEEEVNLGDPNGAICYKQCDSGKYCARGTTECIAAPKDKCFDPSKSIWIDQCAPGFTCKNGKCDYAKKAMKKHSKKIVAGDPNGKICYKQCDSGKYCVRGTDKCVSPPGKSCFDPSRSVFIDQCAPGFTCKNGKCEYAKKSTKKEKVIHIDLE